MQRAKGVRLWLEERAGRHAIYYIRDGSRKISTGCGVDDLEGANERLASYLAAHVRPNTGERDLSRILCSEVLMLYAQDQPHDKPSLKLIGYHMKALLPFWGEKTLDQVKGSTCRKYSQHRTEPASSRSRPMNGESSQRAISLSTVRRELKTLQAAINHWHKESPLAAVPKVTLPPENPRRERVLERSEAARLLRAARKLKLPHVARFIIIGLYTGTRHAAILQLRWSESLSGGHIDIERGVMFRRGAAERETSKRRPPVAILSSLNGRVARWKKMDDGNFSHVIHFNGQPIAKMKRAWASVVREAGLGRDVTPHVLRHTCASWLLWEGRTIWDVAGVIGADASTVERVYGHHRKIEQERARA